MRKRSSKTPVRSSCTPNRRIARWDPSAISPIADRRVPTEMSWATSRSVRQPILQVVRRGYRQHRGNGRNGLYSRLSARSTRHSISITVRAASSAYFSDIGWVVFHKQLGDTKGDLQFMFKSSPYGSYSHSFADQNTFTLEAYGEPLAISSGYRPWYGSIHHSQYTKTTQAHNGLLVNGQGQIPQSLAAKGNILSFINGQSFDYTAGDAAQAYSRSLLDRYVRHAVYLRPDLYVVFDDVAAPRDIVTPGCCILIIKWRSTRRTTGLFRYGQGTFRYLVVSSAYSTNRRTSSRTADCRWTNRCNGICRRDDGSRKRPPGRALFQPHRVERD